MKINLYNMNHHHPAGRKGSTFGINTIKSFILILFILTTGDGFSQANFYQWVKQFGGDSNDQIMDVITDSQGNVFIYGTNFGSTNLDLDPGSGSAIAPANWGSFLVKLNSSGDYVWSKYLNGSVAYGLLGSGRIHMDKDGNVYILQGFYGGTLDADPGPGTFNLTSATDGSVFLIKLNNDGDFILAKKFDAISAPTQSARGMDVGTDTTGNIFCLINYRGSFDVNPGTTTQSYGASNPNSLGSSVVVKLDNSGNFVWATNQGSFMGTSSSKYELKYLEVGKSGKVFVSGEYSSSSTFPTTTDAYICQLTPTGGISWQKTNSGSGYTLLSCMAIDTAENVIVYGDFAGTVSLNPPSSSTYTYSGGSNSYISKFSASGSFLWANVFPHTSSASIDTDKDNNIVAVGNISSSYGNTDVDPSSGVYEISTTNNADPFIFGLTSSGNFKWAKVFGGGSNESVKAEFIDENGNLFLAGAFDGTTDFNPDNGVNELTSYAANDGYLLKLTNCIYNAPDICLVTVDSLGMNNVIYFDKGQYPLADSFLIFRYDPLSTNYLQVGAVAYSDNVNYLIDTARSVAGPNGGDPQYTSYYYKMAIRGICGDVGTMGKYHQSLFIQETLQNFNWNAYSIENQSSPVTGYQFSRDDNNTGNWHVLVNTGGLSATDPNYASYPNGNWRVDALGFSCNSTGKYNPYTSTVSKSRSNVKNNISVTTQIQQMELQRNLMIGPNPAKTKLEVSYSNNGQLKTEFELTDVLGKILLKQTSSASENTATIALEELEQGIYFLKIKQGKAVVVKKIVKE